MHFIQENVPALKSEPYVNSPRDYISRIGFDISRVYDTDFVEAGGSWKLVNGVPHSYNNTWSKLGKDLYEDVYEDIIESSKHTEEISKQCTVGRTSNSEKIAAIYEYIGKNYQVADHDYIWKTQSLDKLVKDRKGSPSDLNLWLINMLHKVKTRQSASSHKQSSLHLA